MDNNLYAAPRAEVADVIVEPRQWLTMVHRFLAALLVAGGVLGIGIAFWLGYRFVQVHWVYILLAGAFFALFLWACVTGVRLWRGNARGWKWAAILYASQIPVLTVPGLRYAWYTGLSLKLAGGNVVRAFSFDFGAAADFYLDTKITDVVYGINLFAIFALSYLLTHRPNAQLQG